MNLNMPVKKHGCSNVSSLWKLQDDLLTHVRSLKTLGVAGDQYGVFLTPVILSRLPNDIRMEWSREGSGHESDLDWLLNFLQKEIERRERSETFKCVSTGNSENKVGLGLNSEKKNVASASALQITSDVGLCSNKFLCSFCSKGHRSEKCWNVLKLSIKEREEKIRSNGLCFRCLNKGHISKGCKAKCFKCEGNHNILCCPKTV